MRQITAVVLGCWLLVVAGSAGAAVIKVVLLGTGGPPPDPQRAGPAVLVVAGGKRLLFDAGRNVTTRLAQAGYEPDEVDTVLITHLHSDHIVGLADLWLTGWIWRRNHPLRVLGPSGTGRFTRYLEATYEFDRRVRAQGAHGLPRRGSELRGQDIEPGVVYRHGALVVTAFRVDHVGVRPAFGYRVEFGRRSVVISGDTRFSENLISHAQGVDLLVHEVAAAPAGVAEANPRLQRVLAYHTSPSDLGEVLRRTQPRLAILTHLMLFGLQPAQVLAQVNQRYQGSVRLGQDLLWLDVGERLNIHVPVDAAKKNAARSR